MEKPVHPVQLILILPVVCQKCLGSQTNLAKVSVKKLGIPVIFVQAMKKDGSRYASVRCSYSAISLSSVGLLIFNASAICVLFSSRRLY